jgi:hypothetical protein
MNEIMDIILDIQPYGADEIPRYKYNELAEDIYKYIVFLLALNNKK